MKKSVLVFLISLWIAVPSVFAGSRAVIRGSIEPIVIPEVLSMQLAPASSLQQNALPQIESNSKNIQLQTVVEHIGGITVVTVLAL